VAVCQHGLGTKKNSVIVGNILLIESTKSLDRYQGACGDKLVHFAIYEYRDKKMSNRFRHKALLFAVITGSSSVAYGMQAGALQKSPSQKSSSRSATPNYYVQSTAIPRQDAPATAIGHVAAFTVAEMRVVEMDMPRSGRTRSQEVVSKATSADTNTNENSIALVGVVIALISIVRRMRRL